MINLSFWDYYFEDGNVNTVLAPPKKGKTNALVDMCGRAISKGYTILSNIIFFDKEDIVEAKECGWLDKNKKYKLQPKEFKTYALASELIIDSVKYEKVIVLIDEGGITASSYKSQSHSAVQMRFLGFTIRKIGACLIVIAQSKSSVVPDLRQHLTTYETRVIRRKDNTRMLDIMKADHFYSPEKNDYIVEMKPFDKLYNVPQTILAYDHRSFGGFNIDLDLKRLYDITAERKISSIKVKKQLPEIVKEMVAERELNLYLTKQQFMRTGKVAGFLGVDRHTIHNWVEKGILNAIQDAKGDYFFSRAEIINKKMQLKKKNSSVS